MLTDSPTVNVHTIQSVNDWAEGAGDEQFTEFKWPKAEAAATSQYAQTYEPLAKPLDDG
jgi:hypothetical protein